LRLELSLNFVGPNGDRTEIAQGYHPGGLPLFGGHEAVAVRIDPAEVLTKILVGHEFLL